MGRAEAVLVSADIGALGIVLRRVGTEGLDRSKFYFATGMLAVLFVWDIPVEFVVPGILGVAAIFIYLLYRLGRMLDRRESIAPPPGAVQFEPDRIG